MSFFERELDITRNIKLIEWLKSELLTDVSYLFKILINGFKDDVQDMVTDTLANVILISYMLGKRLGTTYSAIELRIESKIRLGILENHDVEKYYGDLSELSRHFANSEKNNIENAQE